MVNESLNVNRHISTISSIYNENSDYPEYPNYSEISKAEWESSNSTLKKLGKVRNEIAHDRGVYKRINNLDHSEYYEEEKVTDLIDSIYDFCHEYPA